MPAKDFIIRWLQRSVFVFVIGIALTVIDVLEYGFTSERIARDLIGAIIVAVAIGLVLGIYYKEK